MVQQFAMRRNPDGTMDNICLNCFRTVGTCTDELKLVEFEQNHQCIAIRTESREASSNVLDFPPDRMIESNRRMQQQASAGEQPANPDKTRERIQFRK